MATGTAEKVDSILPRTEGGRLAELRQRMEHAEQALVNYDAAGASLIKATSNLAYAEAERATQKMAAIGRLVEQVNPATGKPFTVSQADDFAQLDPAYAMYKARCLGLQLRKMEAEHALESARLTAIYAEALVRRAGGMS